MIAGCFFKHVYRAIMETLSRLTSGLCNFYIELIGTVALFTSLFRCALELEEDCLCCLLFNKSVLLSLSAPLFRPWLICEILMMLPVWSAKKAWYLLLFKSLDARKISSPAYLIDTNWYLKLSETWLKADIPRFY